MTAAGRSCWQSRLTGVRERYGSARFRSIVENAPWEILQCVASPCLANRQSCGKVQHVGRFMRRGRKPVFEYLEDRRLLAIVTVSNNNDANNGDTASIAALVASDGGDGISLREAIIASNNTAIEPAGTPDEIRFNIGGGADCRRFNPVPSCRLSRKPRSSMANSQRWLAKPNNFTGTLNTTLTIQLDGQKRALGQTASKSNPTANGAIIRGLAINRFSAQRNSHRGC